MFKANYSRQMTSHYTFKYYHKPFELNANMRTASCMQCHIIVGRSGGRSAVCKFIIIYSIAHVSNHVVSSYTVSRTYGRIVSSCIRIIMQSQPTSVRSE